MSTVSTLALVIGAACALPGLMVSSARADGCYTCGGGSSPVCKDFCRYTGQDTFAARKTCETKGCKVGGPASCPTEATYKVCLAPAALPGGSGATLAVVSWCAAPPRS